MGRAVLVLCVFASLAVAQADRAAPADAKPIHGPIDWPPRLRTLDGSPGVTRDPGFSPGSFLLVRVSDRAAGRPTDLDRADAEALLAALGAPDARWSAEGSGAMVARQWSSGEPATPFDPEAYTVFISASPAPEGEPLILQRTWFALYTPLRGAPPVVNDHAHTDRAAADKPARDSAGEPALALLIPGMFGTPEPIVEQFVLGLRQRGWHVLLMLCQPSRFTERRSFVLDPDAAPEQQVPQIAQLIDDRFAECAYAVEAAVRSLHHRYPELPERRVAVGFSGGALAMPAVIAREPDAYDSVLLIGPGADLFTMSLTSNYAEWIDAVRIEWAGPAPSGPSLAPFSAAYRDATRLDPWALAPGLTDIPALMIVGERDRAVPAELAELLWQRWGPPGRRPERRVVPLGHELLFFGHARIEAARLLARLDAIRRAPPPARWTQPGR